MSEHFKFTQNRECEYFPCHSGVPEEEFNCLFCFCPLYALGKDCGGDFFHHDGIKDCSACVKPHEPGGYEFVMTKIKKIIEIGSQE